MNSRHFHTSFNTRTLCRLVLATAVAAGTVCAQTASTGALTVTVKDATGAVIPGASVRASNGAGVTRSQTTNAEGDYTFSLLPPGDYLVNISATGFRPVDVPGITVHVSETETLSRNLEVGQQQQQLQVTAEAAAIQTETSALGGVVDTREISAVPLATRNYTQILNLSAGVNTPVNNSSAVGIGIAGVFVNGGDDTSNTYQMDGVGISNYAGGAIGSTFYGTVAIPSLDALQEFKVQTSNFDASYGRTAGANVNVVTKSGSNQFHGSLFEFLRNDDLNSNLFFRNSSGQPRGVLKQNQFGGTFGGPIKKDKLFFFTSYQGTRQLNGVAVGAGSTTVTLPATLTNNRSAAALGAAFCPQNNPLGSPGYTYSHTFLGGAPNFPSNQVACDGSNINPVALALLNAQLPGGGGYIIPTPQTILNANTQQAVGFGSYSSPAIFNEDQALLNLDYIISQKHSLALKYYYAFGHTTDPFDGAEPPGSGYKSLSGNGTASGKLTTLVSNNIVNEARFSVFYIRASEQSQFPLTAAGIGLTPSSPFLPITPVFTINGLLTVGGTTIDANRSPQQVFEWSDQLSLTRGRNTFRFGYDETRVNWNICSCEKTRGTLTFQTWSDFLLGESAAQNGTSQSNIFSSSANVQPFSDPNLLRDNQLSAFAQDDIKVSSRLTLNLGLRWEYDGTTYDDNPLGGTNAVWSLFQATPYPSAAGTYAGFTVAQNYQGPLPAGVIRRSTNLLTYGHAPLHNFAPRTGFAWQPANTGDRLVVRGGAGYFWQLLPGQHFLDTLDGEPPLAAPLTYSAAANALATLANPFNPPVSINSFTPFLRTPTSSLSVTAVDPNLITPLTITYNMNIQYAILKTLILETGYIGTRGLHIETSEALNLPVLATAANPVNCGGPLGCITTNTSANAAQRVPVIGLGAGGLRLATNVGDSHYNALQVTLRKTFSHGVQFQGAYTFGKCMSDVDGGTTQTGQGGTANSNAGLQDRRQAYGECDYDRPQRFVLTYVYQFPDVHDARGLEGKLLSGWALSGVTTIQAGTPLTFTDTRAGAVYANVGTLRAQMCPGDTYGNILTPGGVEQNLNQYFNASAFCAPPVVGVVNGVGGATGYGDTGRGIVLGPGQNNWDVSLVKKTKVGGLSESAFLEFRSEYFNAFNHPQFSNPGTQVNSSSFGVITSETVGPRIIQFALRYAF